MFDGSSDASGLSANVLNMLGRLASFSAERLLTTFDLVMSTFREEEVLKE